MILLKNLIKRIRRRKNEKKIVWITPDCFADCDIPYIPELVKYFDIHWIVLLPVKARYKEEDFLKFEKVYNNLKITIINSVTRERYPIKIIEYLKINKIIWQEKPDIVYSNLNPSSPWQIPTFLLFPKNITINTAHQGRVHEGMGHFKYYNFLRDLLYKRIKFVNMFSKSQAKYFHERYPNSKIYQFPLGLKYFGEPKAEIKEREKTSFLSFGTINYAKHLDLLIDAACNIYEKGYKNIKVTIAGKCDDWDKSYLPHIKYPEIFETKIGMIDNEEIPDLYSSADYFVQPYRVISQSGPFKIAMRYNVPLITSNLPGFTDEMIEGTTGFIFESDNVHALEETLIRAIKVKQTSSDYNQLRKRMKDHVDDTYSQNVILRQYVEMFNDVIK